VVVVSRGRSSWQEQEAWIDLQLESGLVLERTEANTDTEPEAVAPGSNVAKTNLRMHELNACKLVFSAS